MSQQCRNSSRLFGSYSHDVHSAGLEEEGAFIVWKIIKARLSIDSDEAFVPVTTWFCQSTRGVFVE